MFQCKDVAEEASNYINKDLPLGKRFGLFMHLIICGCCRNYLQQIRNTISTVSLFHPTEKDLGDTKDLAEKLRNINLKDNCKH